MFIKSVIVSKIDPQCENETQLSMASDEFYQIKVQNQQPEGSGIRISD